jgi:hypothetical protein
MIFKSRECNHLHAESSKGTMRRPAELSEPCSFMLKALR